MNNYVFYGAGRGGGKTVWLMRQVEEALCRGEDVAVIVPNRQMLDAAAQRFLDSDFECNTISERSSLDARGLLIHSPYADVYIERSAYLGRGMRYDQIFVDNAELFEDDPTQFCPRFFPGVPGTFTYTPYPFD